MGSVTRRSSGIATAALILAGMPVTAAHARQVVYVPCSTTALVSAINTANTAGSGTLELASGCDYVLTTAAGSGRGPDGLPLITGDLSIIGGTSTRIVRPPTAALFRILEVSAGAELTLRNVFVLGGKTDAMVATNDTGGGILNSRGIVVLSHTTISGNTADNGAAISNDSGRMSVEYSLIDDNATLPSGGGGGAVYNDGSLTVRFSIVSGNRANTNGGGIYNGQGGVTELARTTVTGNTAGAEGGGIYEAVDGRLRLERTLVEHNTATNGGGIFNAGSAGRVTSTGSLVRTNVPNNCAPAGSVPHCTG